MAIILLAYVRNPELTIRQVNYLRRFAWVGHRKGKEYPECQCLGCKGMEFIREFERSSPEVKEKAIAKAKEVLRKYSIEKYIEKDGMTIKVQKVKEEKEKDVTAVLCEIDALIEERVV